MTLARSLRALLLFALLVPLAAQQCVLPTLRERHAHAEPGSVAWFTTGYEVVEAGSHFDMGAAVADAQELWLAVGQDSPPGVAATTAAMVALACVRTEGPVAARTWVERGGALPDDAAPVLKAHYHLAIARLLCVQGLHAQELGHSIPGQASADQVGDYPLRLRAAMTTMQATPQRSLVAFRRLMNEALASPQAASAEPFLPWLWIEEVQVCFAEGRLPHAQQLLQRLTDAATRDGNRRALGIAASLRAGLARRTKDMAAARAAIDAAMVAFSELGDTKEVSGCDDALAWLASENGEYEVARTLLDRAEARIRDRGFDKMQDELLKTRFRLAVREHDGDAVAALQDEIDRRADLVAADKKKLDDVRAELAKAEEERGRAEQRLRTEQAEAASRRADTRTLGGLGIGGVSAVFAWLLWRSRGRLQAANRALGAQVRAVQRAKREQAALETRMRQLERAESLGTLAAGIAHDFNNLLTSILGNAELLQLEPAGAGSASLAGAIRAAGQQAARLCKQLQVYAGATPLDLQPCDLVAVAREMLPVLRSSTGGAVAVELAPLTEVGVRVDRGQLEQVLLNLVVNARDAGARNVRIDVTRVERVAGIDGPAAALTVRDDGAGMPAEVLRRVFDPFFTTRFPGRGLGLAVVYGAVRRHGGTIGVTSEPGQGACFTIHLPLAAVQAANEPDVLLPTLPPRPVFASTWVVDDEPAVRDMLVRMLRTLGHEATATGDGDAFLHAVSRLPDELPVVAFVDLTMPGMDGPEVVRSLRELRADTRIVLMTGHSQDQLEQAAAELRPAATMRKPFLIADVQRIVAGLCPAPRGERTATR